jgi:hypothetical protein
VYSLVFTCANWDRFAAKGRFGNRGNNYSNRMLDELEDKKTNEEEIDLQFESVCIQPVRFIATPSFPQQYLHSIYKFR